MNPLTRTDPLLNLAYLGLGTMAAAAGIWTMAAAKLVILQGLGLMALVPSGVLLAIGLCRLVRLACRSAKLSLPPLPPSLSEPVSLTKMRYSVAEALKPDVGWNDSRGGAPGWVVRTD